MIALREESLLISIIFWSSYLTQMIPAKEDQQKGHFSISDYPTLICLLFQIAQYNWTI